MKAWTSGKMAGIMTGLAALALFFLAAAPGTCAAPGEGSITVAAASDLGFALREVAAAFEKETGVRVVLSFGSTGMLASQIAAGAPFDVFLSADEGYVKNLENGGFVLPGTVRVYAYGRLSAVSNAASGLAIKDLKTLVDPAVKKIAIANPGHAPYGRAALEALKKAGAWEGVREKLVYGENVRQALQFVQAGDAQAGVVAASLARAQGVRATSVDEALHGPITQTGAVLRSSKNAAAATGFLKSLASPAGRAVLLRFGFRVPEAKKN